MALFGNKKDAKENESAKKQSKTTVLTTDLNTESLIKKPRLSEKSVIGGDNNVYTFEIRKDANKHQIKNAVKALYNVTPVKVNIVNKKPAKRLMGSRGRSKHVPGMKKAYVYLKKGDSITLV